MKRHQTNGTHFNEAHGSQMVYNFHTDQIGTLLELTDAGGRIISQATYRSCMSKRVGGRGKDGVFPPLRGIHRGEYIAF